MLDTAAAALALGLLASSGTLVVMVPTGTGLVVAADSRTTVRGRVCDDTPKIVEVDAPDPTVVAVPGMVRITEVAPGADPCHADRTAPRVLDLERVAKEHVERHSVPNTRADMTALANAAVGAIRAVRASSPDVARFFAGRAGRAVCQIVVATWDRRGQRARIGLANITIDRAGGDPHVAETEVWTLGRDARRTLVGLGQWDYVASQVLTRGRHLVPEYLRFMEGHHTVAETSEREAVVAVVNLIEGASRMTAIVPAEYPIGGPVSVVLLGAAARPVRLRPPSP